MTHVCIDQYPDVILRVPSCVSRAARVEVKGVRLFANLTLTLDPYRIQVCEHTLTQSCQTV